MNRVKRAAKELINARETKAMTNTGVALEIMVDGGRLVQEDSLAYLGAAGYRYGTMEIVLMR